MMKVREVMEILAEGGWFAVKEYLVIYERGSRNWSAYVPDLPGCVAAADTREKVARLIREAIEFHIRGLKEEGLPVPEPTAIARSVKVPG